MPVVNLKPPFHVMAKPRGAICNLDCQYCFYLAKEALYPAGSFRMPDEVLENFTRQYIEAQPWPQVTFSWQGGEPALMGREFFARALEYQQKYRKPGMAIHNAFQTNGVLLDEEWAAFLKEHKFLVGLSLDGPEALHDAYRVDKGGRPTFGRVMAGLELLKRYGVEYNILACVHAANVTHPLEVYRFFRDEAGAQFLQFIPVVEHSREPGSPAVGPHSVTGQQYGHFLNAIFDEWVRRDVGQVFVQTFDVALAGWLGQPPGLCIHEETCGLAMAIEHTGDVYACDHFVTPEHYLGNIGAVSLGDLVVSAQQTRFGQTKRDKLPRMCRECEVRFICNGGCPKDRFLRTPDGEPGLNYLCAGYKNFFTHIDRPMKVMAGLLHQRRPPAEVMEILAAEPASSKKPGRGRRKTKIS